MRVFSLRRGFTNKYTYSITMVIAVQNENDQFVYDQRIYVEKLQQNHLKHILILTTNNYISTKSMSHKY